MVDSPVFDPYLIQGTTVLRNLAGIIDSAEFDAFESTSARLRMIEFFDSNPQVEPTLRGVRAIHYQLFQDVYDWAGQLRTINMGKGESLFLPLEFFSNGIEYFERTLKEDHYLQGLNRVQFIERLAMNFDNLNVLHPFREGNGRTQRLFWSVIARDAGWDIQWPQISAQENIDASVQALLHVNYQPLMALFDRCVSPLDRYSLVFSMLNHQPILDSGKQYATEISEDIRQRHSSRYIASSNSQSHRPTRRRKSRGR
ncbi:hypothetical protein GCM10007377_14740 [Galliscardovia ingluviei]|uniref:protein adenylyltransferase n=1 Tax=Galliscardovia ingluviei TaxID=1769422 RepID=A0A8J3AJX2_9BIFI|nr:Fic family protein [Galliscardovia ingluviei]GGI15205.1 hypothetical protein GCM10007377_14740 [Galliscardovia ingluviei]